MNYNFLTCPNFPPCIIILDWKPPILKNVTILNLYSVFFPLPPFLAFISLLFSFPSQPRAFLPFFLFVSYSFSPSLFLIILKMSYPDIGSQSSWMHKEFMSCVFNQSIISGGKAFNSGIHWGGHMVQSQTSWQCTVIIISQHNRKFL